MKKITSYIVTLFFVAIAFQLQAQATLSIQGIIQKSNGAAVDDGNYDLTFKLYPATTGGTAVHTETQNVAVAGGIYSTELGASTPLTAAFDQTYYLGVSVDGGAELIPRARLTSSPYALALLGTSNVFASSGSVGIGTITPVVSYQLHVKNDAGAGKMLVEGSTASQIDFKKSSTAGSIGFGTANNDFVVNPGANNTALQYNGTTKLSVTNNGADVAGNLTAGNLTAASTVTTINGVTTGKLAVGQNGVDANNALKVVGSTYLNGFVEVNGPKSNYFIGQVTYFTNNTGNSLASFQSGNQDVGMKVSGRLNANEFWASSDRRIKQDFHLSESLADLHTLRQLRVTDYRHIDVIGKGSGLKKGFIAQEVKEVYAEAVTTAPDFIPNVYAVSSNTRLSAGNLVIDLDKNHDFVVGDEVKLILPEGDRKLVVVEVPSDHSFSVNWNEAAPAEKVFVFGKKVSDFHTVDYDRIFTLNVSATQELARQMELLKKENAALRSELNASKEENSEMKASVEKMDTRLRTLESKLTN